MGTRRSLGRRFGWLWTAYAVSAFGTWLAFDAFPLIAITVLHAGPARVSALAAAGLLVGAVVAVPLGPWVEFRRKRPVMIAMDLVRCAALLSLPAAFVLGGLGFTHLLVVSVVVAAADIAFTAASGACLKALVRPDDLLAANGRLESTAWTATMLGPPLGGAAIGLFGPLVTVAANAVSFLLSAAGIRAIGGTEPCPARGGARLRAGDLLEGWRHILTSPALRPLFLNTILVSGLIMATAPVLAVLMLGRLGFAPWQYALAFAAPCVGGLVGSRSSGRLAARFGRPRIMLVFGTLRACWLLGLALVRPGVGGLLLVIAVELGLITCMGVFNPLYATYRLEWTPPDRVARVLSAWSVTSRITTAAMTGLWGLLAGLTGPRTAVAVAGVLSMATPALLFRNRRALSGPDDLTQVSASASVKREGEGGPIMIEIKSIEKPDDRRDFPRGHLEIANLSGLVFGKATFEPGWRWTESVREIAGTDLCEVHHNGYVVEGRMHILTRDGVEQEVGPGDVFVVAPGHDAWVVGDEACVVFDFAGGMGEYAKARH
ncbi:MFS transporter [Actinomadura mexicana]|uniref:Predicted arabinose efflux permease, MFS family n=1 Tax=Actinomadura mexicana TaxID=134959 RepID=A0A239C798_9ACTN|nr:MFS transporter [Actinomadura mexicana]SNS16125.1 Predicted arabinose efflux permease, MFS family [Actinomadura mexicana]